MAKRRYAVWFPKDRRYLAGENGGLAHTEDREEADRMASELKGEVVDADDFAKNWLAYAEGERKPNLD